MRHNKQMYRTRKHTRAFLASFLGNHARAFLRNKESIALAEHDCATTPRQ